MVKPQRSGKASDHEEEACWENPGFPHGVQPPEVSCSPSRPGLWAAVPWVASPGCELCMSEPSEYKAMDFERAAGLGRGEKPGGTAPAASSAGATLQGADMVDRGLDDKPKGLRARLGADVWVITWVVPQGA